ncbi:MAG: sigma 54-interacting transcriptional regulator [Clostridiales Family XIII bacterium]|jgi:PAS domain S-box-containing protein|nr:sigma 54-interacting transcriptional regulator [Clostridiales Family XIII bacterium]
MNRLFEHLMPPEGDIKYQNSFYKLMVEYLGEEITVTDSRGYVLYVNPAAVRVFGLPVDKLIGMNVSELIEQGYMSNSCTLEVLEKKRTVSLLQKLKDGRTILATGVPIFDDDMNRIVLVISTSKDVKEITNLIEVVDDQQKALIEKNEVIEELRSHIFEDIGFITGSPHMHRLKQTVARIAPLEVTVLIDGETGVGKEVVARALHRFSNRKDRPFVKINCGILPDNLVESELFGYEAGAFTGAAKEGKRGKIEMADGGTLFLDEIAEMSLNTQTKFREFLQDGTYTRISGTQSRVTDIRIIAATNADLRQMCEKGKFRRDLFFRLNVIPLTIPPLRERSEDIDVLAKYFLTKLNTKYKTIKALSEEAMECLYLHAWPGNVRELAHIIERVYIMTDGDLIESGIVSDALMGSDVVPEDQPEQTELRPLKEAKRKLEEDLVKQAYNLTGSTYKAAHMLQVDQSTIVRILNRTAQ